MISRSAVRLSCFARPLVALGFAAAALLWLPAPATAQQCECTPSICSAQGFVISLTAYSVDQDNGSSSWTYEICNDDPDTCDCADEYKNRNGVCHDLSHIDISLPALGTCLTENQSLSFAQVGGVTQAQMECSVSEKDPSCDITGTATVDFVAKCNIADGHNLDPGECVSMQLSIAGETPTLGHGGASTVTKAGNQCATDAICGPACDCEVPSTGDSCLTRSPGFWGNHPHITAPFLPITVCGVPLTTLFPGSCASAIEALCVSPGLEANRRLDRNPPYAQLVRQLAAAKLNLRATAANDGACPDVAARIAACEMLCQASKSVISRSGCIEDLDAFNNSLDTMALTPPPFDAPGPAYPALCKAATGNGVVIGKQCP